MSVKVLLLMLTILVLAGLSACSGDAGTGPGEIKWDRDACDRCRMVLSDPRHAAQIRYFPAEKKRSQVAVFDDIGCASLWLAGQPWRDDPKTEIWVTDHRSGKWIDARSATYVTGHVTPMEYGLGAQAEPMAGGLTFAQARAHFLEVEKRFNTHGVQLLERLEEQSRQRHADEHAGHDPLPTIRQESE